MRYERRSLLEQQYRDLHELDFEDYTVTCPNCFRTKPKGNPEDNCPKCAAGIARAKAQIAADRAARGGAQ